MKIESHYKRAIENQSSIDGLLTEHFRKHEQDDGLFDMAIKYAAKVYLLSITVDDSNVKHRLHDVKFVEEMERQRSIATVDLSWIASEYLAIVKRATQLDSDKRV